MQLEMRTLPEKRVLVVLRRGALHGDFSEAANAAFKALTDFVEKKNLWGQVESCIGITPDDPSLSPPEENRYYAGFFLRPGAEVEVEGEVNSMTFPPGRYAVFTHKGPYELLWQTWSAAYRDWLPTSGEKLRDGMPFEVYVSDKQTTPAQELITEIYIPIQ